MKKVCVLTALYNHKVEYVRQCLDSLLNQTLKECEFILIDNGANTENKNLIEEYLGKDERFRVLHLVHNLGTGVAMNQGMRASNAEYIGFLESDDYASPAFLSDLYKVSIHRQIDVIKALYQTLDEKGQIKIEKNFPDQQCNRILHQHECYGLIQKHVSHWSGIYKRAFLEKNNILFSETPGAHSQDFGFMIQIYAYAQSVYIIPSAYVTYRIQSGNHAAKHLNDNMIDECELVFDKLRHRVFGKEFWRIFYKRVALRLKICTETANREQRKRIKYLLSGIEQKQDYKYFSQTEQKGIRSFLHNNIVTEFKHWIFYRENSGNEKGIKIFGTMFRKERTLPGKTIRECFWGILKSKVEEYKAKYYLFGIPLLAKYDTLHKRYIKIFGIPVYYRSNFSHAHLLKIESQISYMHSLYENQCKSVQLLNQKISNMKCVMEAQSLHPQTFGPYKNAFTEKEVVLVCTGPTAKIYKPIRDAIHVGVNGAIYLSYVKLDYLFIQDYTIKQKCNSTLNADTIKYEGNQCRKFFGIIPDDRNEVNKKCDILRIPLPCSYHPRISRYVLEDWSLHNIASDLSREPMGEFCGTSFSALQFILYTHPKRLFLVGWDCGSGYAYDKPNAMSPANYQRDIFVRYFVPFIRINYPDIEVIMLNPVGLKGIFNDIYYA